MSEIHLHDCCITETNRSTITIKFTNKQQRCRPI